MDGTGCAVRTHTSLSSGPGCTWARCQWTRWEVVTCSHSLHQCLLLEAFLCVHARVYLPVRLSPSPTAGDWAWALVARQGLCQELTPQPGARSHTVPWFFSCKSSTRVCKLSSLFCSFRHVFPVVSSDGDCESIRKLLRCDIKSLFNISFINLQITSKHFSYEKFKTLF